MQSEPLLLLLFRLADVFEGGKIRVKQTVIVLMKIVLLLFLATAAIIVKALRERKLVPACIVWVVRARVHRRPGVLAARMLSDFAIAMEAKSVLELVQELHASKLVRLLSHGSLDLLHSVQHMTNLLVDEQLVLVQWRLLRLLIVLLLGLLSEIVAFGHHGRSRFLFLWKSRSGLLLDLLVSMVRLYYGRVEVILE